MKSTLLATASLLTLATPSIAAAQAPAEASPAPIESPAAAAPTTDESGITDIVVTAQRRSENLQRAAIAISAVTGDALVSSGISSPADLGKLVPALQAQPSSGPYTNFYIRGVGNFNGNALSESAVAFNYDGVYIGRPSATTGFFYDLARVEVLKGPQGTLYGRNATGGAINVIPNRAEFGQREMNATFEYGNYQAVNVQAAINLPIGDDMAVRASGIVARHDGYLRNGGDNQKDYGGRLMFRAQPTDSLEINVGADAFHQGGSGTNVTPIATGIGNRFGSASPQGNAYITTQLAGLGALFPALPNNFYRSNDYWGVNGSIKHDSSIGTFTVVSAYREAHIDTLSYTLSSIYQRENGKQANIEVRYQSPQDRPIRLLLGGFYYDESNRTPLFNVNNAYNQAIQTYQSGTKSSAAFGSVTWAAKENLRFTGALRYSHDKKDFSGDYLTLLTTCLTFPPAPCAVGHPSSYSLQNMVNPEPNVALLPDGTVVPTFYGDGSAQFGNLIAVDQQASFSKLTWRAGVDWDVTPSNLLYASYETGFKAGGFFFSHADPSGGETGVFRPETISAWTIGSKNRFLDNRLQINAELFLWKYKNQQVSHLTLDSAQTAIFATENVGRATFKGAELNGIFRPFGQTQLSADIQYLEAQYDSFTYSVPNFGPPITGCGVVGGGANYTIDCSGRRPPQAPKWSINLGLQQTIAVGSGDVILSGKAHYQSGIDTTFDYVAAQKQDGYWITDAVVTWNLPGKTVSVSAFVNNIANKTVLTLAYAVPFATDPGFYNGSLNPPRTYGLRLGVQF